MAFSDDLGSSAILGESNITKRVKEIIITKAKNTGRSDIHIKHAQIKQTIQHNVQTDI